MKKIYIPILITSYIAWLVFGFFFARNIWVASAEAITTSDWKQDQQTILIIQVDDLTAAKPELVSSWALFSDFSGSPTLAFKSLFPSESDKLNETLVKSFGLTSNKEPSSQFIKSLDAMQFTWNSVIVIDQLGAQSLYRWVSQSNIKKDSVVEVRLSSNHNLSEVSLFQNVCSHLERASSLPDLALEWARLVPDHLHTNITLETFTMMWGKMISSDQTVHCEAIP